MGVRRNGEILSIEPAFRCRICESKNLLKVFDMGTQTLTGVFPSDRKEEVTSGPLRLVWCEACNLLQLGDTYSLTEMYGDNYGYQSSLNSSMVRHLSHKARTLEKKFPLEAGDHVLDVGSNDATLLNSFTTNGVIRIGMDPVGPKFEDAYSDNVRLIPDFFSSERYFAEVTARPRIICSIAMLYDLPNPRSFVQGIAEVLADDGIWHFEQSYLPSMLKTNSFDTVCHEHLEYYSLGVIAALLEQADLKILDVDLNSVNGGSLAVTAAKASSNHHQNKVLIDWMIREEKKLALDTAEPYLRFAAKSREIRDSLTDIVAELNSDGKSVAGYGASTKGNVTLQYCGFSAENLEFVAEVNDYKFGRYTPGSLIPIISESEIMERSPDYLLLLPWHFREGLLAKESDFLLSGGKFIIPFPSVEVVS